MWQSRRHHDILPAGIGSLETHDMDKFTTITVEQQDAIEILSLDRPDALNAVTPAMADELIGEMAHASPMGLRLTKQTLNALIDAPGIDAALMIEDRQQVILLETSDHQEAVAAFRERRDPSYSDQ
jgi:enoyl-CoA hydratase/carnithine racemase